MRAQSILVLLALTSGATAQELRPAPRNVVLIVIDDVGVDLIGAYDAHARSLGWPAGHPASTPAIDEMLAGRGVMFTNAWTNPMCSPSRAAMLTGRHGFRTGVGRVLPHDGDRREVEHPGLASHLTILPQLLHTAPTRYTSAALGKWHLASAGQLAKAPRHPLGEPAGTWFDVYAGSMFNLSSPSGGPGAPDNYWNWLKTYATAVPGRTSANEGEVLPLQVARSAPPWTNYVTVDTTEDAIAAAHNLPQPWFLYVAYNAPHAPFHDVPRELPRANCDEFKYPKAPCDSSSTATPAARVRCALSEADAQIARLLCELDLDSTCVILIGDNGTSNEALLPPVPAERAKDSVYQGGVNVPLIVRSPDVPTQLRGSKCDALVSSTDLFATIAEIAGAKSSAEDSLSLMPHLRGASTSSRKILYVEEFTPNFTPDVKTGLPPADYRADRHAQAVRDERFKLIRIKRRDRKDASHVRVREEFYDLARGGELDTSVDPARARPDPYESNDLLRNELTLSPEAAQALAVLRAELDTRYPNLAR